MAENNIQINALPQAATPLSDEDIFHCKQGIVDKRATLSDILHPHASREDNPHKTTKEQVGLTYVTNDRQLTVYNCLSDVPDKAAGRNNLGVYSKDEANAALNAHASRDDNPHKTTKAQVGLGNVDNFSTAITYRDASSDKFVSAKVVNDLYQMICNMYPVGHRLFTTNPHNPADYLPVGRWELASLGRVCVGFDSSKDIGTQYGSSSITIDYTNLPSHMHSVSVRGANHTHAATAISDIQGSHAHTVSGNTTAGGSHTHSGRFFPSNTSLEGGTSARRSWAYNVGYNGEDLLEPSVEHQHFFQANTTSTGEHQHNISVGVGWSGDSTMTGTTDAQGLQRPFSIEQPSEVVYIWERKS